MSSITNKSVCGYSNGDGMLRIFFSASSKAVRSAVTLGFTVLRRKKSM